MGKILKLTLATLSVGLVTSWNLMPESSAADPAPIVTSSENVTTSISDGIIKVYLDTFRPNVKIYFRIKFYNSNPLTLINSGKTVTVDKSGTLQFSLTSGPTISVAALNKPIDEFDTESSSAFLQVFAAPANFPVIDLSGDTTLISHKDILSTPVVDDGSYAIDSVGTDIKYFIWSPRNIIGFRKLTDRAPELGLGGVPAYAYLEQKDFSVSATSPGYWKILDPQFSPLATLSTIQTQFGNLYPEGHDFTISPSGYPVVITTPIRVVDSSWLAKPYALPVLDCNIAEVKYGKAVHEFSFWNWASTHKSLSKPLLDAMPIFNDPMNPTSSPIDVCHINSMEYFKPLNEYLFSLRSPSVLLVVSSDLKTVKQIISADSSLQHFARFNSPTEITALGNYPFAKNSQFLDFTYAKNKWTLAKTQFPVDVGYCGNTSYIDPSHIWLAGGCGAFTKDTLGVIYERTGGILKEIGKVTIENFNYSYRGDLIQ
jgi:hypothetical protein